MQSQLPKLPPTVVFSYVPPANENAQSQATSGTAANNGVSKGAEKMDEDDTPGPNIVFKPIVNDNNYIPITTGGNNNNNNYSNYSNNNSTNNSNKNDEYEQMELIEDDD